MSANVEYTEETLLRERKQCAKLMKLCKAKEEEYFSELKKTEALKATLEEENRRRKEFAATARKEYEEMAQEATRWQEEYKKADALLMELQAQLNGRQTNQDANLIAKQEQRIRGLEEDLAKGKSRIDELSVQIAEGQRKREEAISSAAHDEAKKRSKLQDVRKDQNKHLDALKAEIKDLVDELERVKRSSARWQEEYKKQQQKRDVGKLRIQELLATHKRMEQEHAEQVAATQGEIAKLEAKLDEELGRDAPDVGASMVILREKCNHWLGKYKATKIEREEAISEKERLEKKVISLRDELKTLRNEASILRLKVGLDASQETFTTQTRSMAVLSPISASPEPGSSPSKKQALLDEILVMQERIRAVEDNIQALQEENDHWKNMYQEAEEQCTAYQLRLQSLLKRP